jgi:hypothetical protein
MQNYIKKGTNMSKSSGRKRFWFQQTRETDQIIVKKA